MKRDSEMNLPSQKWLSFTLFIDIAIPRRTRDIMIFPEIQTSALSAKRVFPLLSEITMVRSNTWQDYHEAIGFLNNSRACVAFSRGKRKTIIVGDQTTLTKNKFLARAIDTVTRKDGFFIWRNSN